MNPKKKSRRSRASVSIQALDLASLVSFTALLDSDVIYFINCNYVEKRYSIHVLSSSVTSNYRFPQLTNKRSLVMTDLANNLHRKTPPFITH
jgi:hypothetical protein